MEVAEASVPVSERETKPGRMSRFFSDIKEKAKFLHAKAEREAKRRSLRREPDGAAAHTSRGRQEPERGAENATRNTVDNFRKVKLQRR